MLRLSTPAQAWALQVSLSRALVQYTCCMSSLNQCSFSRSGSRQGQATLWSCQQCGSGSFCLLRILLTAHFLNTLAFRPGLYKTIVADAFCLTVTRWSRVHGLCRTSSAGWSHLQLPLASLLQTAGELRSCLAAQLAGEWDSVAANSWGALHGCTLVHTHCQLVQLCDIVGCIISSARLAGQFKCLSCIVLYSPVLLLSSCWRCVGNLRSTDGSDVDLSLLNTSAAHIKAGLAARKDFTDKVCCCVLHGRQCVLVAQLTHTWLHRTSWTSCATRSVSRAGALTSNIAHQQGLS